MPDPELRNRVFMTLEKERSQRRKSLGIDSSGTTHTFLLSETFQFPRLSSNNGSSEGYSSAKQEEQETRNFRHVSLGGSMQPKTQTMPSPTKTNKLGKM